MKQIFRFFAVWGPFLSAVLLAPGFSFAQDRLVVEGIVKDAGGEPLIGVSVVEVGTTNGVNTDLKGNYRIQVVPGARLRFTYVGYKPQEIVVLKNRYDIKMVATELSIDQVGVTGYSQTEIRKSTGSVNVISGKDLNDSPIAYLEYLL